ncbi:hypothetical protein K7432_016382 [Basidiobolus ranarum]|uniref:Uncharacterized protein n=1 Tax=Basidiobolus ranarum TaxID=34480 RepID=A0ABR2WET5_9FUNG
MKYSVLNLLVAGIISLSSTVHGQQGIDFQQLVTMTRGRHIEVMPSAKGSDPSEIIIIVKDPASSTGNSKKISDPQNSESQNIDGKDIAHKGSNRKPEAADTSMDTWSDPSREGRGHGEQEMGNRNSISPEDWTHQSNHDFGNIPSSISDKPTATASPSRSIDSSEATKTNINWNTSTPSSELKTGTPRDLATEKPNSSFQIPAIATIPLEPSIMLSVTTANTNKPTATPSLSSITSASVSGTKSISFSFSSLSWTFSSAPTGAPDKPTNGRPAIIPTAISAASHCQLTYLGSLSLIIGAGWIIL